MKEGGDWVRVMAIGLGLTIVNVAEAVLVGLAVEAAVIVTVLPGGTELEAVKVVVAPLAVCVGLKAPQLDPPQVTVQSAPLFWASLATVTLSIACALC
jgi:hypothetical protein